MAIYWGDSTGAQQWNKSLPIYGAGTNVKQGAFLKWGTSDGTNQGFAIPVAVNTALAANFIGIADAPFAAATLDNDPATGLKYLLTPCTINPKGIYIAQYDNSYGANALTVTGIGATTVVTSGENIGGGWLMFDNFELHYVLSSSSGTYTTKSATSSAITTSNKVAKIFYPGEVKCSLTSDFTQIGTNIAAQGAVQLAVVDNYIKAIGFDFVMLDPTKHDNLILPFNTTTQPIKPALFATLQSTQHWLA